MTDSCYNIGYLGTVCEHMINKSIQRCIHCEMKSQIDALTDTYKSLTIQISELHEHKIRQIDENRKISKRVDELEKVINYINRHVNDENVNKRRIDELEELNKKCFDANPMKYIEERFIELESSDYDERISDLEKIGVESRLFKLESSNSKKPHACPVCKGKGKKLFNLPKGGYYEDSCHCCDGKGIVWG